MFLVNRAKGIHKPAGLEYAVSVRESLSSSYADHAPTIHEDGSWTYRYYQERFDPTLRDRQFTNVVLLAYQRDGIPVGVIRQTEQKPASMYRVMGLALVRDWKGGYFLLEGFSPAGTIRRPLVSSKNQENQNIGEEFSPANIEDTRRWIPASIVWRQGQGKFRTSVLAAYGSHCAISTCDVPDALEAAHIFRYLGENTNVVTNGTLLRSDLHSLYDLGLIAIDPGSMRVLNG